MKKPLCIIFCFALMFCAAPFCVSAESGVTVKMENDYLQAGENVSLNITLNAGRPVQAFQYTVEYAPQVLTLVSVSGGMYNVYETGKIRYINIGSSTTDSVTFVFSTRMSGQASISVTDVAAADDNEYTYSSVTYAFNIEVPTRGDADGDGNINTSDLAVLKLYLAGVTDSIDDRADFNRDSVIDTTDLASLKRYLAEV